MARIGTYLQNALLNATLLDISFTSPTLVYAGLHTSDPTDTTATALANEVVGSAYVREAITFGSPISGITSTTVDLLWPVATGTWGTIGFISIWDASTNGNLLFHGPVSPPVSIGNTDQLKILAGNLVVQLT
jgi:hypothetical protein